MKVSRFTIQRGDIDRIIHSLKALGKLADNPKIRTRFVACNLLETSSPPWYKRLFKKSHGMRVIVQIDREAKAYGQNLQR